MPLRCGAKELNTLRIPSSVKDSFRQTFYLSDSTPISLIDVSSLSVLSTCFTSPSRQDSTLNIDIEKSGVYVIIFGICDPSSVAIQMDGFVESINPCAFRC
jgi:hypothetical protein